MTTQRLESRLADLRRQFDSALVAALAGSEDVVLLDHPSHSNIGDHLIALGGFRALARINVRVRGVMQARHYDPDRLSAMLGEKTVLVQHGGGNLGDLWGSSQRLRMRLLEDFPARSIIQLPQSVEFGETIAAEAFADAVRAHSDYRLMARDHRSMERLRGLGLDPVLVPDAALSLPTLARREARTEVLWLRRADVEGLDDSGRTLPFACEVTDWTKPRHPNLRVRAAQFAARRAVEAMRAGPWMVEAGTRREQRRGVGLLSRGRVVLTDRLHAGVLAALAGIPGVVTPDRFGKIEALWSTWDLAEVFPPLVPDMDSAIAQLHQLLEVTA